MGAALVARLGRAALAAWGIASLVFLLGRSSAGAPAVLAQLEAADLGNVAAASAPTGVRRAARQALRARLELDLPAFYLTRQRGVWRWHGPRNQYHRWLARALRGDLGRSYRDGRPVSEMLREALTYTLPLTAGGALLAGLGAVLLALRLAAQPAGSRLARWVRTGLTGLYTLPLFVVALALLLLLANPDALDLFPAYGLGDDGTPVASARWLAAYLAHSALPLACLVLAALPELTLTLEAALRRELQTDYATAAYAKGLPRRQVLRRHALPNALLPLIATFSELLPALVAGAVVVEVVFALPGTGRLLAEAAAARDYPVVVGGVLWAAAARLLALLLADVLYRRADPRLRPAS